MEQDRLAGPPAPRRVTPSLPARPHSALSTACRTACQSAPIRSSPTRLPPVAPSSRSILALFSRSVPILADGGGSDGHRPRLWKARLQERIADRYGLHVTVCHYPTGASKWNPVEHRLFGPVSINWAGQPLRSLETMLGWIRGTEVGGAWVTASLDTAEYPTGVKVTNEEMRRLDPERHEVCPAWNYTISPRHTQLLN
jgi:Rhodopirellula transposase DDE domain